MPRRPYRKKTTAKERGHLRKEAAIYKEIFDATKLDNKLDDTPPKDDIFRAHKEHCITCLVSFLRGYCDKVTKRHLERWLDRVNTKITARWYKTPHFDDTSQYVILFTLIWEAVEIYTYTTIGDIYNMLMSCLYLAYTCAGGEICYLSEFFGRCCRLWDKKKREHIARFWEDLLALINRASTVLHAVQTDKRFYLGQTILLLTGPFKGTFKMAVK